MEFSIVHGSLLPIGFLLYVGSLTSFGFFKVDGSLLLDGLLSMYLFYLWYVARFVVDGLLLPGGSLS